MISLSYAELAAVVGGQLFNEHLAGLKFKGVTIDSRNVDAKELFIAIRGEHHDGHHYIKQAVESGASGVILEKSYTDISLISNDISVVAVDDSHKAMLELAAYHRHQFKAKFVGITGSNGKTTTKELTYRMLKVFEDKSYCSPGNFNNLFGVPLALFSIDKAARLVVMEMGISTKDEMPRLAEIVQPDVVLFTNVGPSHLEFLATVEDVARAKLKLLEKVTARVPAIVNADDKILLAEAKKIRNDIVTFGIKNKAEYTIDSVDRDKMGNYLVTIENNKFVLPLVGMHQVYNLLASYAVCRTLGYTFDGIDTSKIELNTAPMRGQTIIKDGIKFVADCYNANPDSVKAGLEGFFEIKTGKRKVIILGDMLELGDDAKKYHREIGKILSQYKFDLLLTVGKMAKNIADEFKNKKISTHFVNSTKAASAMKDILQKNDLVYLKASRGIGLEKILNVFDNGGAI